MSEGEHRTVWLKAWPDEEARAAYEAEARRRGFSVGITADGQSAIECELLPIRLADLLDLREAGVCDRLGFDPVGRIEVVSYVAGFERVVTAFLAEVAVGLGGTVV